MKRAAIALLHRMQLGRSEFMQQFVKFSLVGVTNTAWDFAVYAALTRGWLGFQLHYLSANFIAFFVSVVNSYYFNKRWTFRNDDSRHHVQFSKFFLVNLVTLGLYELLLYTFVGRLHLYDFLGKGIAIVIVLVWNFSLNKYWTFRVAS